MTAKTFLSGLALASALAIGTTASSAELRAQDRENDMTEMAAPTPTVYVQNNNALSVRVYIVGDGRREKLGTIASFATGEFELPAWFFSTYREFQLVAYQIGSRGAVITQNLFALPGDMVELLVTADLTSSRASVYRPS